jgi:hypothetical protein
MQTSQQNDRPDVGAPDLPVQQRKILAGPSATFIVAETAPKNNSQAEVNKECPHFSAGNLKRTCLHLGDADRAAILKIREELELPSSALAVRMAVRRLAERLARPMVETALAMGGQNERRNERRAARLAAAGVKHE